MRQALLSNDVGTLQALFWILLTPFATGVTENLQRAPMKLVHSAKPGPT